MSVYCIVYFCVFDLWREGRIDPKVTLAFRRGAQASLPCQRVILSRPSYRRSQILR
jgi:hypothetical protein